MALKFYPAALGVAADEQVPIDQPNVGQPMDGEGRSAQLDKVVVHPDIRGSFGWDQLVAVDRGMFETLILEDLRAWPGSSPVLNSAQCFPP